MRTLFMALLAVPSLSFAQLQRSQSAPEPKAQVIIFDGDEVLGAIDGPAEERLNVKRPALFESLVKVRTDFNDKVLHSVHEM